MRGHRTTGAAAGLAAVAFRQTNIVWVGWAAAVRLLDDLNAAGVATEGWTVGFDATKRAVRNAFRVLPRLLLAYWAHFGNAEVWCG